MIVDLAARAARLLPPEAAHRAGLLGLKLGAARRGPPPQECPALETMLAGLKLPNPVGLAPGFDKNAEVPDEALRLGFGFVEIGAVTPRPQAGNPRPRLFRLDEDRAVINRMGFNNDGLDAIARRLEKRYRRGGVGSVGVNLGANKDSEDRAGDYVKGLVRLWGLADYFTVNVSSPNTPALRELQGRDALGALLDRLAEARAGRAGDTAAPPMFLKVAPDLNEDEIDAIASAARETGVDGLVVSNTTVARPASLKSRFKDEQGGLSGRPLFEPSTRVLKLFRQATAGRVPLIGVGGIEDAATAYAKIRAGASAVQLYTAMVFEGPGLAARILEGLNELIQRDGFAHIGEAVGVDVKL
ncbi:MAG: quinone-dependent dihydroorotate dehydrogenase [Maricaulaceae bacterium]|jgi:dihydroorotate dehydrogenase